ncbi:threonylcarbamoyl-AMP synthase [bacterium]|nr:threonylcarbamoyl-AMP synthase [bacterium]MCB2178975.1 threonylcarbamoyl-AMP synthase [bacterium]
MTRPLTLSANQPDAIRQAVGVLQAGGTVAFPTDTVYGLAADAFSEVAIQKLFEIKERQPNQAIAVLIGDPDHLEQLAENISPAALALARKHWPGALTVIVPRKAGVPEVLSPTPTLGVRMPDHPVALALLRASGPLAVTSANLSGHENTTTAEEVLAQLSGRFDLLLDGGSTPGGVPSTVVDMTGERPVVLRQGPITIHPDDF